MKKLLEILAVAPELGQCENIFWFDDDDCEHLDFNDFFNTCRDCGQEM